MNHAKWITAIAVAGVALTGVLATARAAHGRELERLPALTGRDLCLGEAPRRLRSALRGAEGIRVECRVHRGGEGAIRLADKMASDHTNMGEQVFAALREHYTEQQIL